MYQGSELKDYEMVDLAKIWKKQFGLMSTAYLQRKLKISYTKAVEIVSIATEDLIKE